MHARAIETNVGLTANDGAAQHALEPTARMRKGEFALRLAPHVRPLNSIREPKSMTDELRVCYRLFLYAPEDRRIALQMRVCPDVEQVHGRHETTWLFLSSILKRSAFALENLE